MKLFFSLSSARRDLWLLFVVQFGMSFAMGIYFGIITNFITERLGVQPYQLGILESLREVPGLLTAFTASLVAGLAEPRLGLLALSINGLGVALTGQAKSFSFLIMSAMLWSIGFHLWTSVSPGLTMRVAQENQEGRRLGQMSSVSSLASLSALALVFFGAKSIGYSHLFLLSGLLLLLSSLPCWFLSQDLATPGRQPILFRWKYRRYYGLVFLEGCRRQIFTTFAAYALVREYHTSVQTMALLMLINGFSTLITAPKVGEWVDRVGERKVLSFYYLGLILIFTGYATLRKAYLLYLLYCLDSLLFTCGVGINTYLRRIVPPQEMTPTLAMGVTMNHIAAVTVPLIGGALWSRWSYPVTFLAGAVVAGASLKVALALPEKAEGVSSTLKEGEPLAEPRGR